MFVPCKDFYFDSEVIDRHFQSLEFGRKAHAVFLRGDDEIQVPTAASRGEFPEFLIGESMVICEAPGDFEGRSQRGEVLFKALRPGNAGNHGDVFPAQVLQGLSISRIVEALQVERLMAALDDFRSAIVSADALNQRGVPLRRRLRNEDMARAPQVSGRFPQSAARKEVFVSKRNLGIDKAYFKSMPKSQVLHAVVENQGIALHLANGVERGANAILVHEDDDVAQGFREHVRFVAGEAAIEEKATAIVNGARFSSFKAEPLPLEPPQQGRPLALVAATQNRHPAAMILQGARKHFHHGRFPSAADSQIADGDDEARRMMLAQKAPPIKPQPCLDTASEKPAQPIQKPA